MGNNNLSSKLFARPSFIEGFSRILDIGTTLQEYNSSNTGVEADNKALESDWRAVGSDLRFAISKYENRATK